jgi:hypothetical protein
MNVKYPYYLYFSILLACMGGCIAEPTELPQANLEEPMAAAATNRVDIPGTVRRNLGITFAKAEARHVAQTIRAPGRFEWAPEAWREYRAMISGRVELHVIQYDRVESGSLLFTLDSPQWRELQQRLYGTESELRQASARVESSAPLMAAHERHHYELEQSVALWRERLDQLEKTRQSGVVTDEEFARVRAQLVSARADLAEVEEKEALLQARKIEAETERNAAQGQFELLLQNAASLLGIPVEELTQPDPASKLGQPRWRTIKQVEVRASASGMVESIGMTNGSWAAESSLVLTTVQPEVIRFRAQGLQSDLPKYMTAATARVVPPRAPGFDINESVEAALTIGLEAHPGERAISLIATPRRQEPWMRAGVSAFMEVVVESSEGLALAIPRSSVVKDGITHVFFRRDPADPNKAIRVEADMGVDDGRWVVIHSGLALGDEVVLDGAYELKLATAQSGATQQGGHFHADGTFHESH